MAGAGNADARPPGYAGGAFRAAPEHHPHVGVDRWRVIQPRPLVAERFGQLRVHRSVGRGCERARYLHVPTLTIGRLVIRAKACRATGDASTWGNRPPPRWAGAAVRCG